MKEEEGLGPIQVDGIRTVEVGGGVWIGQIYFENGAEVKDGEHSGIGLGEVSWQFSYILEQPQEAIEP